MNECQSPYSYRVLSKITLQKTYFGDVRLEIFRQVFYQWNYQGSKGTCQVLPTGQCFSELRCAYAYLMSSGLCIYESLLRRASHKSVFSQGMGCRTLSVRRHKRGQSLRFESLQGM